MSKGKPLSLIVATLFPEFGIGFKNALPWKLRNEMKYFKTVTTNAPTGHQNAVIMGRNTWESIPAKFRPLPNRLNVIISSTLSNLPNEDNVHYYNTVESALDALNSMDTIHRVFIMGGAQLYNHCLYNKLVDDLLITEVYSNSQDVEVPMDTFLGKEFILDNYTKTSRDALEQHLGFKPDEKQTEGTFQYEFTLYKLK
ncbi:dihydrofolate reductase [Cyberlindnera jadinii NRRL Y-1542]|uniref:Dihydrofolate reductase n=1 Tax=Cyberlindnera jadinii (strain ATCC 18201 / CBS 1600 / BCRC 20928 / JCM 3617 / NBRC 0987 / NRRL Y-1542) TaxID=983966 RepID=A0A1E4S694_CYBJN|nr:dihydrofolate reductase [Cyberlindnera jadinii NRRL Y-1542]ODV75035.1 dihydrofolate reductase [Cyberlindnera jadinii NRRL Y-1542]